MVSEGTLHHEPAFASEIGGETVVHDELAASGCRNESINSIDRILLQADFGAFSMASIRSPHAHRFVPSRYVYL
jgi:hypothetical protein